MEAMTSRNDIVAEFDEQDRIQVSVRTGRENEVESFYVFVYGDQYYNDL